MYGVLSVCVCVNVRVCKLKVNCVEWGRVCVCVREGKGSTNVMCVNVNVWSV